AVDSLETVGTCIGRQCDGRAVGEGRVTSARARVEGQAPRDPGRTASDAEEADVLLEPDADERVEPRSHRPVAVHRQLTRGIHATAVALPGAEHVIRSRVGEEIDYRSVAV